MTSRLPRARATVGETVAELDRTTLSAMAHDEQPKAFEAYAVGLVYASVCSSLPPEAVADRLNDACPTGLDSRWTIATDATFRDGTPNPSPCPDHPTTHKHYLLSC